MRVYNSFENREYQPQKRRKRVLALVSDAFGAGGGIAKFNRDLLTATSASSTVSGVVAVTRTQSTPPKDLPIKLFYDTRGAGRGSHSIVSKMNYIREIFHIMRQFQQVDIIICGLISLLPIAYLASRIKRAPLWFVIHGIDAWQPHRSPLVNWVARHADGVIAVSGFTKHGFHEWSDFPLENIILLPNCYDPALYGPGEKSASLLHRYGLQGKTVLMTMGRLAANEQYKGFDEIMDSLPELAKEIPNIAYLIVGDGDDKPRLQKKAEKLGVADRVVFAGYIPEMEKADHYRLADAYVMPGRGEGFGIVYLEAMACGIPTVASKLDGSRDALRNGQLGFLADPTDLKGVQQAVTQALKKEKGIPEGLAYFSVGAYRQRTFDLLNQLLASGEKMQ